MSRIVVFDRFGGPEVLRIAEDEPDDPQPGEVRVRVEAAAVNPLDVMSRSGTLPAPIPLPHARLGVEATGVVEAVGPGSQGFRAGDPVIVTAIPNAVTQGSYADRITIPAHDLIPRPAQLSVPEAASSWVAFSTAYGALVETAGLRPGDRVAITAAAGTVGRAAVQVARAIGAIPFAVTRTPDKAEELEAAGAAATVATDRVNAADALRRLTDGTGVDVVLDLVRGPGQAALVHATRPGGVLLAAGFLDARPTPPPARDDVTVVGYRGFETLADPDAVARMATAFADGIGRGAFVTSVARKFPLTEVVEAHRFYESGLNGGRKVILIAAG